MTVQSARLRVFLLSPDTAAGNEGLLCLPWDGDPIQMITLRFGYFLLQLVQVTPGKVQLIFSMLIEAALSVSQAVFISMLSIVRLLIATARTNHQSACCSAAHHNQAARPPFLVPKKIFTALVISVALHLILFGI